MALSFSQTSQRLKELGHEPRKQLGQNFLIDSNIVQKSLRMAQLQAGESVVEVGPGLGTLTETMLEQGARVYAVEFDHRLYQYLQENLQPRFPQTLHLLHADALDHPLGGLPIAEFDAPQNGGGHFTQTANFKIIANLPYAISTPWLEAVLHGLVRPCQMVLMLQKEAAERFIAEPGSKTYGAISIFTASAYRVAASHAVSRQCFYPIPKVDSVLLSLEALPDPHPWPPLARYFVRQFFIHRRKQIGSLVRRAIEEIAEAAKERKPSAKARKIAAAGATSDAAPADTLPVMITTVQQAEVASEHLHNWLAALQQSGIPPETRPEVIPLASWQKLQ